MGQFAVAKNISFFRDYRDSYAKNISELDTYTAIRSTVGQAVWGAKRLLDVGNGLVFNYDVEKVRQIVALDLFLDQINTSIYPKNIRFKKGSALNIPELNESFDTVLMEMLLHHLVNKTSNGSLLNARQAVSEAFRVLKPNGKLVVIESCVPEWFYTLERCVYPIAARLVDQFLPHPMVLQYPMPVLSRILSRHDPNVAVEKIPKGCWLLQFGFKYPAALTPVEPWIFVAHKR